MIIHNVIIVPDGTSGKFLDPGIQGASLGKNVCMGVSNPSQALPALCPQKGNSRDPAAMEEMYAESTPYSFEA